MTDYIPIQTKQTKSEKKRSTICSLYQNLTQEEMDQKKRAGITT